IALLVEHPARVLQITLEGDVAKQRAGTIVVQKRVKPGFQLRASGAHGKGNGAAVTQDQVVVNLDVGQHLRPEPGQIIVRHRVVDHAAVDHLEHVAGLEVTGGDF